jgi:hypothetical protein
VKKEMKGAGILRGEISGTDDPLGRPRMSETLIRTIC